MSLRQVAVHVELRADISARGFCKQSTTAMVGILIFNLDAGSYLCMTPEKIIAKG